MDRNYNRQKNLIVELILIFEMFLALKGKKAVSGCFGAQSETFVAVFQL
jgi:hypothetical protein